MKAIVTVIGKDQVGIIAKVSSLLSDLRVNVEDISQTIMQEYFVMMMMVDVSATSEISVVAHQLDELGKQIGLSIRIQHEDIFNAMHNV